MLKQYRPDIDGLRALAILPVVLFHVGVPGITGGYIGVDIFFVISGYVIAQSLLSDLREKRFSIFGFYERRVRRILPAFIVMAVACFVAALAELPPPDMADFSKSLASSAAFASNMYFWNNSGYFETAALTRPLLHTWSLSVEEQYYLFVPFALWLTYKYASRRMFAFFSVAAAVSLIVCVFAIDKAPTASFFLLPTRAWELLLGALLVLKPDHRRLPPFVYDALGVLGAAFIITSIVTFDDATPFPGMAALLPTVGAALIIFVGTERMTPVSRLLSWRPFVMIGLISYSLYLAHWPIIVFTRYVTLKDPDTLQKCVIVLASFALAFLSWRFVERPFRRPGSFAPRRVILIAAVLLLASVGAAGGYGIITKGFAARYPDYEDAMAAAHATGGAGESWKENVCFLQGQDADAWKADECLRTKGAEGNAILWGDSFAAHYIPGLIANQDHLSRNIVQYTFAGCPPILDYKSYARPGCSEFNRRIFGIVEKFHADTVILSCRWDQSRTRGFDGLRDTVKALQAKGLKVFVIGQSPTFAFSVAYLSLRHAGQRPDGSAGWEISADPEINRKVAEAAGAAYVNPLATLCKDRTCDYMRSTSLLFFDYGHLTQVGSTLAVQTYFPLFTW